MAVEMELLKKRILVAVGEIPADTVIKNGKIIDVFNLEILSGDIAITDGTIAGIGTYEGKETIDTGDCFVVPGLIDAHVHIESSMVCPSEFEKVVLPHGVTAVVADPHEIANVLGEAGITFMLENSEGLDLDVFFMLPSCVPATPFEHAGAVLLNEQLSPFYKHPRVLGLAEVMDYPSVKNLDPQMLEKLVAASPYKIDGHGAGLDRAGINVFAAAGIQTDHECVTPEQVKERLSNGMYVMLRQGSAAKNLKDLLVAVNDSNRSRCMFCTDDKHLDDLIAEGSIDHHIRLAVEQGFNPLAAVQMATINAAQCFGLKHKGAVAPGYDADLIFVEDLDRFTVKAVYKAGKCVARDGKLLKEVSLDQLAGTISSSVFIREITEEDLCIPVRKGRKANVIEIIPNQIETRKKVMEVPSAGGAFMPSTEQDLAKLAVIERHRATGHIGLAICKGLGIRTGAVASTIAHDSHNLIVAGVNDEDILLAIGTLKKIGGGLAVADQGKLLAAMPLPIAGLMSGQSTEKAAAQFAAVKEALREICEDKGFDLLLTLSFLSLPVIPELKITDLGLFDSVTFQHIAVSAPS
ncbi:adenine deaminase [Weizmannia acidilactici]|uniref:Adenine deaminase n=1 Tax=Weizmannia acidilactici TaxID=2607726 RepID=A0A5J4JE59_9BACI|nr:adenine deaminase [Weizmannia acidilactici]GER66603.1 adenine deaminase [Weizmannia acidilactici]GER68875.1 adenine deaminase [Weizmannia acidilactici]GER73502.1 adenine deaminase [Weizmannia acidilactici]